jgi:uncharacterized protein YndB with AHSA1/START domain
MKSDITGRTSTTINASISKVWEALITPSIIKQYFFGTDAISDWKVGSPLIFKGEWQGKNMRIRVLYWTSCHKKYLNTATGVLCLALKTSRRIM